MVMPDDIFGEFKDHETELKQFLLFLRKRMPQGKFQLVLNHDIECLYGDNLVLSSKLRGTIIDHAKQQKSIFLFELNKKDFVHAIFIQEFEAVLIYRLTKHNSDSSFEKYEAIAIHLSIELFMSHLSLKNEQDFLTTLR